MCGIAGVYNASGEPVAVPLLRRMSSVIGHRGPDGVGDFTDGPVGLSHSRLAIIDLTPSGHQPIANETGSVVLTYNGEIYNFQNLRLELEARGHQFHSRTDSEVVVHAYEEWGVAALSRFNGMFAFALWDAPQRRLLLARDRFGIKPLYYFWDGRQLVFGSEIKAILAHPAVPRRVCAEALDQYFTFQNVLTDHTLFDGIRLLPAGHFMTLDEGGSPCTKQYWDFDFTRPETMSRDEAAEELHRLFVQAVTRQLVSDVPVGSYLSGGVDSGSITSVARRSLGRLTTFTCGFDLTSASGLELAYDERANAERLANLLKTEHYEVVLHAGDMEHVMSDLVWHLEDLRVGQCYPNYYVARLASKFVKVVLAGTGGDELMAGYPWRYFRGTPGDGTSAFYQAYYNFWQRLVPDAEKDQLLLPAARRADGPSTFEVFRDVMASAAGAPRGNTAADFVNASLYFELKTFLHGLLIVEDKISMAHGLETRVPFLDHDLVDFAQKIPVEHKLRDLDRQEQFIDENQPGKLRLYESQRGDGKVVLRQAMNRLIPDDIIHRAKQGFSAPDASWFRGDSIEYVKRSVGDRRARIYEYLDAGYVSAKVAEHTSGARNHRLFIWSLLSFEAWLRRFMP
ncbi:MAG TPA: asparagine synthase (glutamine-hydrolyzing) [Vicinamibacterales bacterium]|nr:asparagine synthase (glutamine-hydrolyzing) [Vicinamibacterales bacterium]